MRINAQINGNIVSVACPFCGQVTDLTLTDKEIKAYIENKSINEENFPDMNKFGREALISGMCYECQEATFHTPAPGHEKIFGRFIAHCECCDAPIWECDKMGHKYVCVQCGEELRIEPQNKEKRNSGGEDKNE